LELEGRLLLLIVVVFVVRIVEERSEGLIVEGGGVERGRGRSRFSVGGGSHDMVFLVLKLALKVVQSALCVAPKSTGVERGRGGCWKKGEKRDRGGGEVKGSR